MKELSFKEAWKIVKHKGCVYLPTVQQKVETALRTVRPALLAWEDQELMHEIGFKTQGRGGFDAVCKDIEKRLAKDGLL